MLKPGRFQKAAPIPFGAFAVVGAGSYGRPQSHVEPSQVLCGQPQVIFKHQGYLVNRQRESIVPPHHRFEGPPKVTMTWARWFWLRDLGQWFRYSSAGRRKMGAEISHRCPSGRTQACIAGKRLRSQDRIAINIPCLLHQQPTFSMSKSTREKACASQQAWRCASARQIAIQIHNAFDNCWTC